MADPYEGPLDRNGRPLRGAAARSARGGTPRPPGRSRSKEEPLLPPGGSEPKAARLPWDTEDAKKRMEETKALLKVMGLSPDKVSQGYYGMHQLLAGLMREPAMVITPQEAQMVGEQLYNAIVLYDLVWLLRYAPLFGLVVSVGMVESNTVRRVREARRLRTAPPPSGPPQAPPPEMAEGWAPPAQETNGKGTAEATREVLAEPGVDPTGELLGGVE